MDGLRLSLIVAGVVVVAVVYFWTARRRRIDREAGSFDRFDAWSDHTRDPLVDDADAHLTREQDVQIPTDTAQPHTPRGREERDLALTKPPTVLDPVHGPPVSGPTEILDGGDRDAAAPGGDMLQGLDAIAGSLRAEDEPTLGELSSLDSEAVAPPVAEKKRRNKTRVPGADAPRRAGRSARRKADAGQAELELTPPCDADAEMVVILNVLARDGEQLDGEAIHACLRSAGLRFGEMQAYHFFENGRSDMDAPLFSVLNAVNPGTLNPEHGSSLKTPGIALVMRLSASSQALERFETMRQMGERLANELNAQLCDASRSTLTLQASNHLREQIAEFGRRNRLGA